MTGIPFGKYQLVKRLARGGMAEVFLARQCGPEGFQRMVAVKRILPHLVEAQDFVRMFLDEARLAAQLSHPNIVHVYDFGRVDEHYFIAMEYVDGVHAGALIQHAEAERMPDVLVARIGAEASAGLHYAHELREAEGRMLHIVHRDVSPPNLLVSFDGSVKLVDFGIAKAVSSIEQTRPGVVKGKYAYMSPEQTIGQKLDGRSDVFSLAVVLWELLAGKVLVPRLDPVEGMRMLRDGRLPAIEQERPDVAPALAAAIGRALKTRREERSTALELGRALEEFIKGSSDLVSALELAQWVRERFPRGDPSGSYPALVDAPSGTRPATGATHTALPAPSRPIAVPHVAVAVPTATHAALEPPAQASLAGQAEVPGRVTRPMDEMFVESNSVIVAPDWMAEEGDPEEFDTLAEPREVETVDADAETYHFRRGHLHTGVVPHLRGREIVGPTASVRAYPRPASHLVGKAGRIALVIAAGTSIGVGGTLVLSQLRGGQADPLAEVEVTVAPPSPRTAPASSPISGPRQFPSQEPPSAPAPAVESAPLPVAPAVVDVVTVPRGARVLLDGRPPARSPARFEGLAPGAYRMRVSLRGHVPVERNFEVSGGEHRTIEVDLAGPKGVSRRRADPRNAPQPPASGVLKVRTRPYSEVYLDGRRLGQTPLVTELKPGRYTLVFVHPGKTSQRRTATVRAGAETKLDFALD